MTIEPDVALSVMAACEAPLLIGVRHHSPACALAVPALLDRFRPERVLVELPEELAPWLPWVGHAETVAPIALAAADATAGLLAFYPLADFSPELAAIRWAIARGVPVAPFDLPLARRGDKVRFTLGDAERDRPAPLFARLLEVARVPDGDALWERLVETPGLVADAEVVRRGALAFGWAMRADSALDGSARARDLLREAHMRERLADGPRTAVIVGAYHAAALVPDASIDPLPRPTPPKTRGRAKKKADPPPVTSLVPYSFERLDARSGYPAGIADPRWRQRTWEAARDARPIVDVAAEVIVAACRAVRDQDHVAALPDAAEALRFACDLAALRGLPHPGRRELVEAVGSALGRGEPLGRGRVLARALDAVMVGDARGALAPDTPRSGLLPHVEELLAALRLPGPGPRSAPPQTLRLDPLRSDIDRRRHVALQRLTAIGVEYADAEDGDDETLGRAWTVRWTPSTELTLEAASGLGVTLAQAAEGAVRAQIGRLDDAGRLAPAVRLEALAIAAECGLGDVVREQLRALYGDDFLGVAGLVDIAGAIALIDRVARGHVPGLPPPDAAPARRAPGGVDPFTMPDDLGRAPLLLAGVRAIEGLLGSDRAEDARALAAFVRRYDRVAAGEPLGGGRLAWALDRLAADGTPLMQGAAGAARVAADLDDAGAFGVRVAGWLDAAAGPASRHALARRLAGALLVLGPLFEAHPALVAAVAERVEGLPDDAFLGRLPALRDGFDALSTAARDRFLDALEARLGEAGRRLRAELDHDPDRLAVWAAADAVGRDALARAGLAPPPARLPDGEAAAAPAPAGHRISPHDRWRLILGRATDTLDPSLQPLAATLDALYGRGHGEGSRDDLDGDAPGDDAGSVMPRDWPTALADRYGDEVVDEIRARAAERGDPDALAAIDPDEVQPSVELLERILSLRGGRSEAETARLRRLARRVIDELVARLAAAVRPALAGLGVPRPTRRRGGRLDLPRTLAANLRHVRRRDGETVVVPETPIFRTRGRRTVDRHLILLVDVSGSMEASVVHAAILAAILAGLPALEVSFAAFSTDIVDLSGLVDDPLGLLLSARVGGGTDIGRALRWAQGRIDVPQHTVCVVVSDFDESVSVPRLLAEVRALVEAGVVVLGLAALDEDARPRYHAPVAERVAAAGMPVAALTPAALATWVAERLR